MNKVKIPMSNVKITDKRIRASVMTEEEYERLKKSIKQTGLRNPIIVTQDLELIAGWLRLKAFSEIHEEEPNNEDFFGIETLIVLPKEEMEDLKLDFVDGRASDYMRDTACDRLSIIYDPKIFKDKKLYEFLGINKKELKNRIAVGKSIRIGILKDKNSFIESYKRKHYNHTEAFLRFNALLSMEKPVEKEDDREIFGRKREKLVFEKHENEENKEEGFEINDWL